MEYGAKELNRLLATDSRFKVASMLLAVGHISMHQLVESIPWVRQGSGLSCSYFLKKGYIEEDTVPKVLVRNYGYKRFVPGVTGVDPKAVSLLPYDDAKKFLTLAFRVYRGYLILAMVEPANMEIQRKISRLTSWPVKAMVASEREIVDGFREYYHIAEEEYRGFFRPLPDQLIDEPSWGDLDSANMGELISGALEDYVYSKRRRAKSSGGMVDNLKRLFSK